MAEEYSNDNKVLPSIEPDPHGQAAMLMVESLIHGLIEKDVITSADAVEMVDVAVAVKSEIGVELSETPATLQKSIDLLKGIGASLSYDIPG